ncbi:hypothetical protein K492DRAFT_179103 [Lichtheimia hyalospora FSU 10163]|nr:hypothetical protein K492DRAFT_179103 [Lichtheimia hyalospora FSU 10163]
MGKRKRSERTKEPSQQEQSGSRERKSLEDTPLALKAGYAYVSLEGTAIEAISHQEQTMNVIPPHYIQNRVQRDGHSWHHVTIINPKELPRALEAIGIEYDKKKKYHLVRALVDHLLREFGDANLWDPPEDLGLAYAEHQDTKAYYHVLHWPFGHRIRERLGLGHAFFHVTIGFDHKDVHGTYKGPGTLLCLSHSNFYQKHHYERLADLAPYYNNDYDFIKALVKQGLATHNFRISMSLAWTYLRGVNTQTHTYL